MVPPTGRAVGMSKQQLMGIKVGAARQSNNLNMEWRAIATAPFERDLQLAVIERDGVHSLVFPCRRVLHGWVKSKTHSPVNVHPTHWREWDDAVSLPFLRPAS